ncbi:hypothetical protein V4S31_07475 [Enterococcus cecorum]
MKKYSFLTGLVVFASIFALSGCGQSDSKTKASADSSNKEIFSGKIEKNKTIKVLENDTAISKGYFKEVLAAFNEYLC